MKSLTISVVSDSKDLRERLCRELGKKSPGEDDLNFYHAKSPELILTALEAARFPEKVQSILYSLAISDFVVIAVEKITPAIGEAIVATALSGKKGLIFTSLQPEELFPLTKDTPLAHFPVFSETLPMRTAVLSFSPERSEGALKGIIDHSFDVKGVGAVALGFVSRGTLKVHDKLSVFPSGKSLEVRSIQMHDDDYSSASAGDRFGISFKGVPADELSKGDVLSFPGKIQVSKGFSARGTLSKFSKKALSGGETIHVSIGLQFVPAKIVSGSIEPGKEGSIDLAFEAPVAYDSDDTVYFVRMNEKLLRVVGAGKVSA